MGNPVGAEQGQLAPPFQDVSPLHHGQPDRAQEKPQSAEALKCGEIRILDGGQGVSRSTVVSVAKP